MQSTTDGQHTFAQIPQAEIQRSTFNRSCGIKTTFDAGDLVPIFADEVLPGDTMALELSIFARLATPIHPVMDNMFLDVFFFFVPLRLLWDNWQKFNGEQRDPEDSTDFLTPIMVSPDPNGHQSGSLSDYLGIPTLVPGLEHSTFFHRAYNLIFNEWFRDENLQGSWNNPTDDGPDTPGDFQIRKRGKRQDYFTSCLPFPQKGPAVELPLGTSAPLVFPGALAVTGSGDLQPRFTIDDVNDVIENTGAGASGLQLNSTPTLQDKMEWHTTKLETTQAALETGVADLSSATAATINSIRQAFQIQKLYERDARGGTRYTEIVRAHFGVTSPDQRLQRPEFLGGKTLNVSISPVPQTSQSDTTAQGKLAGFGVATGPGGGFTKSFVEHGVILGIVSARADLNYQNGLNRMFSRRTRWDYFWPALAHLGEQAVLNKEIYAQGTTGTPGEDDLAFGYQERHAEYRYKPSQITGQFRSIFAQSLDTWHLAQDYMALPVLDDAFIEEDPPIDRIIAVPAEPHFLLDGYFNYRSVRPMPVYGVPGLIDHF